MSTTRCARLRGEKGSLIHTKGETVVISEQALDEQALREAIGATGYTVSDIRQERWEKRGLFGR